MRQWQREQSAGVLAHPTVLCRDGPLTPARVEAFLDWAVACGFRLWQILPINPPHDVSPYQCVSSFTVNERWFDAEWLRQLEAQSEEEEAVDGPWSAFIRRQWAHYLCFSIGKGIYGGAAWWHWPASARHPNAPMWREVRESVAAQAAWRRQRAAQRAWDWVLAQAHARGIAVIGDVPFFVDADSADVWAQQGLFCLSATGEPTYVAGVPPDYFSATGQRWGNPQYHWPAHEAQAFAWWRARLAAALRWCDGVRLDHFRGFAAVWAIPADAPTAERGEWWPVPGESLLQAVKDDLGGDLPFIAEDLGIITEEVRALQRRFDLPGISVLQFGFDGLPGNPHAPHAIPRWQLACTGTHDNNTTLGWWESIDDVGYRDWILSQLPASDAMPWPLIDAALQSPAQWAVVPLQDWLELGSEARFNIPGTVRPENWRWQVDWALLTPERAKRIRAHVEMAGRLG